MEHVLVDIQGQRKAHAPILPVLPSNHPEDGVERMVRRLIGPVRLGPVCCRGHFSDAHFCAEVLENFTDEASAQIGDDFFGHSVSGYELVKESIAHGTFALTCDWVCLCVPCEFVQYHEHILCLAWCSHPVHQQDVHGNALHRALSVPPSLNVGLVCTAHPVQLARVTSFHELDHVDFHLSPPHAFFHVPHHLFLAGMRGHRIAMYCSQYVGAVGGRHPRKRHSL